MKKIVLALSLIVFIGEKKCIAQKVEQNTTTTGKYTISEVEKNGNVFNCITALRDGNALVAGFYNFDRTKRIATLAKILPNGNLDSTFQDKGNLNFTIDKAQGIEITKTAQHPDGSIAALGNALMNNDGKVGFVMKFWENGDPDTTFISNTDTGYATFFNPFPPDESTDLESIKSNQLTYPTSLIYLTNKKSLVGAFTSWQYIDNQENGNSFVVQLNADGSIDKNFAQSGYFKIDLSPGNDDLLDILEVKDGYVLLVNTNIKYDYSVSNDADIVLIKIDRNGNLDKRFGENGYATFDYNQEQNIGKKLVQMPDGGILIVGDTKSYTDASRANSYDNLFLAKVNTNGTLDHKFGKDGMSDLDILGVDYISKVMIYDNKIMLIGYNKTLIQNFIITYKTGKEILTAAPHLNDLMQEETAHTFIQFLSIDGKELMLPGKDNPVFISVEKFEVPTYANDAIMIGDNLVIAGQYGDGEESQFLISSTLLKLNAGEIRCQNNNLFVYPNPIRDAANIVFSMCEDGDVSILIRDIQGKIVQTMPNKFFNKGEHEERIQLSNTINDGIYFIVLASNNSQKTIKFLKQSN